MKTNPFSYLKKAPRLEGGRRLRINEKAREGDRFAFLENMHTRRKIDQLLGVSDTGLLRIGQSLEGARKEWIADGYVGPSGGSFDGLLYRPTK